MKPINDVFSLLYEKKNIIIVPHKNPDADALGSCLALSLFLQKKGHQTQIISPNIFPKFLHWLPDSNAILIAENQKNNLKEIFDQAEIIFCLDFNTLSRVEILEPYIKNSKATKVLIDHHLSPDEFEFVYSDTQIPATCQMIYHMIEMMGEESMIDKEIATCLYAGIIADTGNFRFSSVKPSTHIVASKLIEKGISSSEIYSNLYEDTSLEKLNLLAEMIHKIEYLDEYNTAIIHLTKEELLKFNYEKGDTEGFVNYGLMLNNCIFSIALFEDLFQENTIKISFRSKGNFDTNTFARNHFEGGGHLNASGGISKIPMKETIKKIKTILAQYKNELQLNVKEK